MRIIPQEAAVQPMDQETRILIVEDYPSDAQLAEREIRQVLPASTFLRVETEEAFRTALAAFKPDLILSDFKLPAFDGLHALRLARELVPDTPFLIFTATINEETAVDCIKAGAWDYLLKDRLKRMGPAIVSALEQRRLRREQKASQEGLAESEQLFRRLFEEHSAIKLIIDPATGRIADANRAAVEFYGWPKEVLVQMRMHEINTMPPGRLDQALQKIRLNERVHFEFRHRLASGEVRDVEVYSSSFEVKGRNLLHSIIHDITERKQAEVELERLRTAMEQVCESIVITDEQGVIQYVNPAFEKVSGFTREEVIGQTPSILKSGQHPEDFYRDLWQTIASGRIWKKNIVSRRKDGSLFTEAVTISPVRDDSGRIINYVAVKRDITEQLKLEAQFLQAQKMESVGRLAGGVAHDFNNLLSVIIGYAELAMDHLDIVHPIRTDLEKIFDAANRSTSIVRQLLAFSRKQAASPQVLDLNATVAGMKSMLNRLIGEEIELVWHPAPHPLTVKIDPSQVDQILANLCVNARDAIARTGKITIRTQEVTLDEEYCVLSSECIPGRYAKLSVSDTGCGMEKEVLAHIFEPFFTTKGTGGTGLGLSTVYGIIHQNAGFIHVYSEPGQGALFTVYLPLHAGEATRSEAGPQQLVSSGDETVLIVEDDPALLTLACTMLKRLGYRVLAADSPAKALELAGDSTRAIDLLMTDVIMPEMNGKELAQRLRALHPECRLLYMSGYTANVIAPHGILEEGIHFLQKPFSRLEVSHKIREALDGR